MEKTEKKEPFFTEGTGWAFTTYLGITMMLGGIWLALIGCLHYLRDGEFPVYTLHDVFVKYQIKELTSWVGLGNFSVLWTLLIVGFGLVVWGTSNRNR